MSSAIRKRVFCIGFVLAEWKVRRLLPGTMMILVRIHVPFVR